MVKKAAESTFCPLPRRRLSVKTEVCPGMFSKIKSRFFNLVLNFNYLADVGRYSNLFQILMADMRHELVSLCV